MTDERRPMGSLENAVLAVIWKSPEGLSPAQVGRELDDDLAYTTVMTICTRLWKKDLLDRTRLGRAFVYRAIVTEDELAARRLREVLEPVENRIEALARFVELLSDNEVDALRRVIDDL